MRQRDPWYNHSHYQPSVYTIWPQPQRDVRMIEITDTLPVMAFGEDLPNIPPALVCFIMLKQKQKLPCSCVAVVPTIYLLINSIFLINIVCFQWLHATLGENIKTFEKIETFEDASLIVCCWRSIRRWISPLDVVSRFWLISRPPVLPDAWETIRTFEQNCIGGHGFKRLADLRPARL